MPLQAGSILRHRYRIEGVLGQGGMGAVYKAFDINLGVAVAVKENLFTTEEYARQFKREATILASLRHPNMPRVTDHFVIEGEGQYLVMDFIQGIDLREKLEKEGAISEAEALPWFLEICDALAYLHSRNPPILHRDIKPGNIKIMPEGRAMLVDFGLAKVVDRGSTTTTGAKAMTPGFSPPEQYGTGRTDPRTDVYSLGATIYAALTATIPEDSLERAMGREELTPVRKRKPTISPALARVISKALAVDPAERYQSVAEMASALASSTRATNPTVVRSLPNLQRRPVTTTTAGEEEQTQLVSQRLKPRRIPRWAFAVAAAAVLLGGAFLFAPKIGSTLASILNPPAEPPAATAPAEVKTPGAIPSATQLVVLPPPTATPTEPPPQPSETAAEATVEVLPATATPTGGGVGQIAFASNRSGIPQIYLINIDGTGVRQLTDLEDGACQPAWSPSGELLVFTSPCRVNQEQYPGSSLWLISVDFAGNASDPTQLRTAPGGDFDPAWDPNGERIAFTSVRDNRPQIYAMDLDGENLVNLNSDLAHNRQPAWAPSGSQIVFTSTRGGETEIWRMPASGGDVDRFSFTNEGERDTHAAWSNDGTLILYERRSNGIPRLIVAPFSEGGFRTNRLCPEGQRAAQPMSEPGWSPDSQWVVFESWPDGVNHNIAIMRSSCTNYFEVSTDPALDFDAAWRPRP
ncbi:MAG: protein kinase [Anaerolineales bacterium]|jgi:serine/threonine protein kinase